MTPPSNHSPIHLIGSLPLRRVLEAQRSLIRENYEAIMHALQLDIDALDQLDSFQAHYANACWFLVPQRLNEIQREIIEQTNTKATCQSHFERQRKFILDVYRLRSLPVDMIPRTAAVPMEELCSADTLPQCPRLLVEVSSTKTPLTSADGNGLNNCLRCGRDLGDEDGYCRRCIRQGRTNLPSEHYDRPAISTMVTAGTPTFFIEDEDEDNEDDKD